MAVLRFTALVPTAERAGLLDQFTNLADAMAARGTFSSAGITMVDSPAAGGPVDAQLRETYRMQHDEMDMEDAEVVDIEVTPHDYTGSINELAMWFARLLTPPATLPAEAALRENDELFEVADTYPWMVQVHP
ncbi:hypothetical protein C1Y63_00235 [Corynebacterium sp. 13CS0277]|uniref:hypothetical protein n=1 Tax=Corynebacterium sp. 13CS0277 TaxID=2071994 RepID=UPI000D042904|nr:hypothetical protein [Corynebacterium sp. 13CS0277]PRQ12526.1 hypothetical protein C1Y63_00235 [Corynebacterium sp. 13CS0277]